MATPVIMPRQGQSVESCIITTWEKKVGDTVKAGDILFTYETDKASFDEEAKLDGTLLAIFHGDGDDVPCLSNVAVIGEVGESFAEFAPDGAGSTPTESAPAETPAAAPTPANEVPQTPVSAPIETPTTTTVSSGAVSPRARATADRMKIDPSTVIGSGPNGRVLERDVLSASHGEVATAPAATASAPAVANAPVSDGTGYHDEKLSNLRKIIGKSMHESLSNMAQLTHNSSFDATNMIALRDQLKACAETMGLPKITYNDIIMYAVSRVLKNHPDLNAHYLGDTMRYFDHVHLGMAVDTPRGLLVVTIFNSDTKSLSEIATECKQLAGEAQSGSINPDYLTGASFTVSNLGSFGVESFTPVINPPQTGILGVDCMMDRVRKVNGEIDVYPAMGISLTYDHRALDGAPASRFLQDLARTMENIQALLCK